MFLHPYIPILNKLKFYHRRKRIKLEYFHDLDTFVISTIDRTGPPLSEILSVL